MPRGFSAWHQRRRPEARLFQSHGHGHEGSSHGSESAETEPFPQSGFSLEQLVDSLMSDGELSMLNLEEEPRQFGEAPMGGTLSMLDSTPEDSMCAVSPAHCCQQSHASAPAACNAHGLPHDSTAMPVAYEFGGGLSAAPPASAPNAAYFSNFSPQASAFGGGTMFGLMNNPNTASMRSSSGDHNCFCAAVAPATTSCADPSEGTSMGWPPVKAEPMMGDQPNPFAHVRAPAASERRGNAYAAAHVMGPSASGTDGPFAACGRPNGWSPEADGLTTAPPRSESDRSPCTNSSPPQAAPQAEQLFLWQESACLLDSDASGSRIITLPEVSASVGHVSLHVELEQPLLYWADRRQWMWHKKWCLPQFTVHAMCDGVPLHETSLASHPMYVVVTAGTMGENGTVLQDQGLNGDCKRQLTHGSAIFSRLSFQQTSFNCGNRPFHLVVALCTVLPQQDFAAPPSAGPPAQLVCLACVRSTSIHVDARKRTKCERPDAQAGDVRLVQRRAGVAPSGGVMPLPAVGSASSRGGGGGMCGAACGMMPHTWRQEPPPLAEPVDGASAMGGPSPSIIMSAVKAMANACCDGGCFEVQPTGRVMHVVSSTVYGYSEQQLGVGASILSVCYEEDKQPFLQTLQALIATAANSGAYSQSQQMTALRILHRVLYWISAEGRTKVTWMDTIINACAHGGAHTILLTSRCALPNTAGADGKGVFQVFPVGPGTGNL